MRQMSWQHTSDHPSKSLPILVSQVSSRDPLNVDQQRVTVAEWQHLMYRLDALEADRVIDRRQSRPMAPLLDRPIDYPMDPPANPPANPLIDSLTDSLPHPRSDRSTPVRPARNDSPMVQIVVMLGKWLSLAFLGFVLAVYVSLSWHQIAIAEFLGDTFLSSWKPLLSLVVGVSAIAVTRESLRTS
jgi:hypothetical protein